MKANKTSNIKKWGMAKRVFVRKDKRKNSPLVGEGCSLRWTLEMLKCIGFLERFGRGGQDRMQECPWFWVGP